MSQEIIDRAISYAYEIGDKDECFMKHVSHTIAAIYVGNGYKNVADYYTPKYNLRESSPKMKTLYKYWEDMENVCKEIGSKEFLKLVKKNKLYDFYFKSYLQPDNYIAEAKKHTLEKKITEILIKIFNKQNSKYITIIRLDFVTNMTYIKYDKKYEKRNKYLLKEITKISENIGDINNTVFEKYLSDDNYDIMPEKISELQDKTDKIINALKTYIKNSKNNPI